MKYNKKYIKVLGLAAAATLTFQACSDDWDEHYDVKPQGTGVTLWQTISSDPSLSNFAKVIRAAQYDRALASSQVFTVFAPTNDKFTEEMANEWIAIYQEDKQGGVKDTENRTIKEFVKNHIALYNHSVSTEYNDTVVMMNGKYMPLTNGADGATMGDENGQLTALNQLHSNGVLFTVANPLYYFPNVFEQLGKIEGLDSIAKFMYDFNEYKFIPEQSVPGGIVNGQTVYLDSVTRLTNKLFNYVDNISVEDSTYWMVVPDNEKWTEMVNEYTNYFNFDDNVAKRDSLQHTWTRLSIIRGTVFSATVNPEKNIMDSVRSTNAMHYTSREILYGNSDIAYYQYNRPFDEGGIFSDVENFPCSNGEVRKANTWNIDKTQTFFQLILTEGESRSYLAGVDGQLGTPEVPKTRTSYINVRPDNPFYEQVSGKSFIEIAPSTAAVNPSAMFYLSDVLSNLPYDVYVVMVPALAADTAATTAQRLPIKARFTLGYHDQSGKSVTTVLTKDMESQADKIDTMLVGSNVIIPTCSYGLTEPQVTLNIESRVTSSQANKKFTRTMRVDAIILKPHVEGSEEVETEK